MGCVWSHSTFLQDVQVRASLNSMGSLRRTRGGDRNISDHVWLSETLKGKATVIRGPLGKITLFLGLWPWRWRWVLPPPSALSLSRGACWKAQSQVPAQYQLPNIFYEVASGCSLPMISFCRDPLVLSWASTELPGSPGFQRCLPISAYCTAERGC